ncbi:hypothetical protein [Methanoregula sp.]|jgi:hypothetical protein|uniref:hypothetical protein n=1 Tax=Methanoregula sp. TaxID=2052170 RepID=UPI003C15AACD
MKPAAEPADTIYFTLQELGVIIVLSVLAALSGALVPSWLFPDNTISDFVYSTLGLPGPGAGELVFGSILFFWLLLGLLLVKKPGTAFAMAVVLIAIDLMAGSQVLVIHTLDVLLFVALIIEVISMAPVERRPWSYLLPACLLVFGITTLAIAVLGFATTGEMDTAVRGTPWSYYLSGIIGLISAFICYRYQVRYLLAVGLASMYYMLHFWLFWGSDFAARFPPDPVMIPVLFLVALLGGVISAAAAYGISRVLRYHVNTGRPNSPDQ